VTDAMCPQGVFTLRSLTNTCSGSKFKRNILLVYTSEIQVWTTPAVMHRACANDYYELGDSQYVNRTEPLDRFFFFFTKLFYCSRGLQPASLYPLFYPT
jgi:hypothetical protein